MFGVDALRLEVQADGKGIVADGVAFMLLLNPKTQLLSNIEQKDIYIERERE